MTPEEKIESLQAQLKEAHKRIEELEVSKAWNETTIATQNVTGSINNSTINKQNEIIESMKAQVNKLQENLAKEIQFRFEDIEMYSSKLLDAEHKLKEAQEEIESHKDEIAVRKHKCDHCGKDKVFIPAGFAMDFGTGFWSCDCPAKKPKKEE